MTSSRKTLLLAGGGYADIPMIEAARRLGYRVITSGNRADELGHRVSDEYCPADFSDPQAILEIARAKGVAAICPSANDFSAISSAFAAEQLGLPGHDPFVTARLIHHKDSYRAFAARTGIPAPKALGFTEPEPALRALESFVLPVLVKPVDLTGGKGISRVDRLDQGSAAVRKAFAISRERRVVIEEFLQGSRHGFSALLHAGRVVFHFADNEHYYQNPYLVSAASTPAAVPDALIPELIRQSERIAELLSLKSGIFHVQYVLRGEQPVIIEICRRPPGDLYVKLVEHATGMDYSMWIVRSFAGEDCSEIRQAAVRGFFTRHCIMADRAGTLGGIEFDPALDGTIHEKFMFFEPGQRVEDHLTAKFGIVFLRFETLRQMLEITPRLQELIKARIVPDG